MRRYNLIPTTKTPLRIRKNSATAIDHIPANHIVECHFKTTISKTDVTDQFPIAVVLRADKPIP